MAGASMNDLNLLNIESDNVDELVQKIESYYLQDSTIKAQLSYHWVRNHMMLDGEQWLQFDKGNGNSMGEWRKHDPLPANDFIPRPVTNYFFDAYQTLKSYLLKNKPHTTVRPNTQAQKDKIAAKLAELCSNVNWERLAEDMNYEYAASNLITYGTVFKKDYWDNSFLAMAKVPRMVEVPKTDPNTGQQVGTEIIQATDESGFPAFDEVPLGDVATDVVEPYRIAIDPICTGLHNPRWIMEFSIKPLNWIVENFDKQEPGYTGRAQEVTEEKSLSGSMRRFYQLKTSSGVRGMNAFPGISGNASGTDQMIEQAAVVKEYYERPTWKHPKGRLIVVANKIPLYVGDSPCEGDAQGDWHPYSECRWELVPGRFWGKSPLDAIAELQRQINAIDSITILTRKTMAIPQKLIPQSCAIPPGSWTGRPGLEIPYRSSSGEIPSTIQASGVDEQVFRERAQKVDDLKQISGAVDILKGDKPPGVSAASALAILFEVGTGKLFPILDRWKKFVENSGKKQLKLMSKKYKEPRPDFIRQLMMKNSELTEDQVKDFIGNDLYDNSNVVIEAASSIPKLKAAEQAMLLELASMNVLGLDSPQNKQEFLSRFGVSGFDSNYSLDVKRAEWENALMENLDKHPDNKPVMLQTDNHDVHVSTHSDFTKTPRFMSLPFAVQQGVFHHIQEHEQAIQQAKQQAAMEAAMSGQPPQPSAPNPTEANSPVRKGKGISQDMKNTLMSDAMGAKGQLLNK